MGPEIGGSFGWDWVGMDNTMNRIHVLTLHLVSSSGPRKPLTTTGEGCSIILHCTPVVYVHTRTRVLSSSFQLRTWAALNAIRVSPRAFNFSHRQIKPKYGVRAIWVCGFRSPFVSVQAGNFADHTASLTNWMNSERSTTWK